MNVIRQKEKRSGAANNLHPLVVFPLVRPIHLHAAENPTNAAAAAVVAESTAAAAVAVDVGAVDCVSLFRSTSSLFPGGSWAAAGSDEIFAFPVGIRD